MNIKIFNKNALFIIIILALVCSCSKFKEKDNVKTDANGNIISNSNDNDWQNQNYNTDPLFGNMQTTLCQNVVNDFFQITGITPVIEDCTINEDICNDLNNNLNVLLYPNPATKKDGATLNINSNKKPVKRDSGYAKASVKVLDNGFPPPLSNTITIPDAVINF